MDCKQHTVEITEKLRENELKVTSSRLKLLDVFEHTKKPLSVKEIQKEVGKGTDKVTLYRNVESLVALGILYKVRLHDRKFYYELASRGHHHHLVCKACKKIVDIELCSVTVPRNFLKSSGFSLVSEHSLEFFGICNSCVI